MEQRGKPRVPSFRDSRVAEAEEVVQGPVVYLSTGFFIAYIQKPLTPDALARKVRQVLDASIQEMRGGEVLKG
jgi:hypothetical protein